MAIPAGLGFINALRSNDHEEIKIAADMIRDVVAPALVEASISRQVMKVDTSKNLVPLSGGYGRTYHVGEGTGGVRVTGGLETPKYEVVDTEIVDCVPYKLHKAKEEDEVKFGAVEDLESYVKKNIVDSIRERENRVLLGALDAADGTGTAIGAELDQDAIQALVKLLDGTQDPKNIIIKTTYFRDTYGWESNEIGDEILAKVINNSPEIFKTYKGLKFFPITNGFDDVDADTDGFILSDPDRVGRVLVPYDVRVENDMEDGIVTIGAYEFFNLAVLVTDAIKAFSMDAVAS